MTVVPIPARSASERERSWMRAVGVLDERARPSASVPPSGSPSLERGRGDLRRDLAGLRAAHAVGDDEQRGADEVVVLVALPLPAQVGPVPVLGDPQHSTLEGELRVPILMRSPACRGWGPRSGSPFRYVPFVEPRSSNTITSPWGDQPGVP